jgi:phage protein D
MPDARDILLDSTAPRFYVGGRELLALGRDAAAVLVEETSAGLKRLSLTLDAIGPRPGSDQEQLLYLDGDPIDFGVEISVAMGRADDALTVFKGRVSAIELVLEQGQTPQVRVLAEDELMDLRMTRRFKTYEDVTEADLVRQIASQHGLQAAADIEGPAAASVQQWNQSDLAFLRDRARRLAADVWVDNGTLHMATRDKRDGSRLTLIQGNDLVAVELRADLAHQRSTVRVGGFDASAKDTIGEEADASVARSDAAGARTGIEVLEQARGERASSHVKDVPLKDDQARAWARAALLRRARRFVTACGVTIGTPALAVGSLLKLERVGPVFEGDDYYVTRVCHSFDPAQGYRTEFDAERGWIGSAA